MRALQATGDSVGYVPTMGALHAGHQALFSAAAKQHPRWISSIFVNPLQFTSTTDLNTYPRPLEADLALLKQSGCALVYVPTAQDFYPTKPTLRLDFGPLGRGMEARARRGHFSGVGVVLARMFHILQPQLVYLGQKDWQQYLIVRQLIEDLDFPIEARAIATLRESDGLAYSSRNVHLSPPARRQAPLLYQGLCQAQQALQNGQSVRLVQKNTLTYWRTQTELKPEYLAIVDSFSLRPITSPAKHPYVSLCVAAHIEGVRLIDNVFLAQSPL